MTADLPQEIGSYETLGVLSRGVFVTVYEARAVAGKRGPVNKAAIKVAIKLPSPELLADAERVERFVRENRRMAEISNPHLLRTLEVQSESEPLHVVTERPPATTLEEVMARRRLTLQEALAVFKAVCRGLDAAHRRELVHRSLSPRNILVSENLSIIKIDGFGLGGPESFGHEMGTLSTAELGLGTLHYLAPEQALRGATVDHRADLYAAGVLLYEMLTARVPVGRFSLPSQVNHDLPPEVDPLILECLATEPGKRAASASRLVAAVARLEDRHRLGLVRELEGISDTTSRILRASPGTWIRSRKGLVATLAFSLLIALSLVALWAGRRGGSAPVASTAPAAAATGAMAAIEELPVEDAGGGEEAKSPPAVAVAAPEAPAPSGSGIPAKPASEKTRPVVSEAPTDTAAEDLRVALDKLEAGLVDPAIEDLEAFVGRYPDHALAPRAYLARGAAEEKKGGDESARAVYVELRSRHSGSDAATEAAFRTARIVAARRGRENQLEARELYRQVVAESPLGPRAAESLAAQAEIESELKLEVNDPELGRRVPAPLVTLRRLTEEHPASPLSESALWRLGELYEDEKLFEQAADVFERLGAGFPETGLDAWWRAGQLYDRKLDDTARAIEAYRKVPAGSRYQDNARRRIARLEG